MRKKSFQFKTAYAITTNADKAIATLSVELVEFPLSFALIGIDEFGAPEIVPDSGRTPAFCKLSCFIRCQ